MEAIKIRVEQFLKEITADDELEIDDFRLQEVSPNVNNFLVGFLTKGVKIKKTITVHYCKAGSEENNAGKVGLLTDFHLEYRLQRGLLTDIYNILADTADECCPLFRWVHASDELGVGLTEDLTADKFIVANESDPGGLHLGKCTQVARSLAVFHAASLLLMKKKPILLQKLKINLDVFPSVSGVGKNPISELQSWPEKWSKKLVVFLEKTKVSNLEDDWNSSKTDVLVVNHGSLNLEKIYLRYRGCGTWDVRLTTFVCPQVAAPTFDLINVIFLCCKLSNPFEDVDLVLQAYHSRLEEMCILLNHNFNYSFEQFQDDFRRKLTFAAWNFICHCEPTSNKFNGEAFDRVMTYFDELGVFC